MKLFSLDGNAIKGIAVFKHSLDQSRIDYYVDQNGIFDIEKLFNDLTRKALTPKPSLSSSDISEVPLEGQQLLERIKALEGFEKSELARACGYEKKLEDGTEKIQFSAFFEALMNAKLSAPASPDQNISSHRQIDNEKAVPSIYDLSYSNVYGEIEWISTGPILEEISLRSDALTCEGVELLNDVPGDRLAIEDFLSAGGFDTKQIYISAEIPLTYTSGQLEVKDSFDESKSLSKDDADCLHVSLVASPSGATHLLDAVYTEKNDSFSCFLRNTSSLSDQSDWSLNIASPARLFVVYTDTSGIQKLLEIGDAVKNIIEVRPNFADSIYVHPAEVSDTPIRFSINLGYTEGKYPELDELDGLDEDSLTNLMSGAGDDFFIYDTELSMTINDRDIKISSLEGKELADSMIRPAEGKVIVYTDSRRCTFSEFPFDYGEVNSPDHGWECEPLKKDIIRNKVEEDAFKYIAEEPSDMHWEYKNVLIRAWISCDVSSNETVEVLEDGSIIMSS